MYINPGQKSIGIIYTNPAVEAAKALRFALGSKDNASQVKNLLLELDKQIKGTSNQEVDATAKMTADAEATAKEKELEAKQIKALIEKLNRVTAQMGIKLELTVTQYGKPLVKVMNEINDKQISSIPLEVALKGLVEGVQSS